MPTTTDLQRLIRTLQHVADSFDADDPADRYARGYADGCRMAARYLSEQIEEGA